jgi:hypothetical protein
MTISPPPTALTVPAGLRGQIAVKDVVGGNNTNPLWISDIDSSAFERALGASLRNYGLASAGRQSGRYLLEATLKTVDKPIIGFSLTVTTTVGYDLIDRASNQSVWTRTVTRSYTASATDAFIYNNRLTLANEGSAKTNIQGFIEELLQSPPMK